jgi:hypothetical protein
MNNAQSATLASGLAWFKSSHNGTEGGQCVEVAAGSGVVHIRDSKAATGPDIRVSSEAWAGFVKQARRSRP